MSEKEQFHIESTLPKSWEQEETFNDVLYEWMSRAPWLAISAALHLVIFLIIQAIPWSLFGQNDEVVIEVDMTNMSLREQYGDKANINLIFTGYFNGKKIDDMRSVKMIRKKGDWYIEKINPDPFAR